MPSPSPPTLLEALKAQLKADLATGDRTLHFEPGGPNVWLFVGVNGVGKTTTVGKVGKRQADEGRAVVMAAGDTFRAAAAEQLETWAERAGADLVRGDEGGDPSSIIFDAVQRAAAQGRRPRARGHRRSAAHQGQPHGGAPQGAARSPTVSPGKVTEVLLVLDATTGQNGLVQAQQFTEAVDLTGVVLTKLDGSAKGGIALAIQSALGIPIKLVGPRRDGRRPGRLRSRRVRRRPLRPGLTGAARRYPADVLTWLSPPPPARVGIGGTRLGVKAGYRAGRAARLPTAVRVRGRRRRRRADRPDDRARAAGQAAGAWPRSAERAAATWPGGSRYELSHSPRTWHLPQPEVEVIGGTAILRGEVPHEVGRVDLERTAAAVAGVVDVENQLGVSGTNGHR